MQLPSDVSEVTTHYLREVDRAVPGLVTGLYLHGSICWGEFYPESDVDFVAVLDHRPGPDEMRALELVQTSVDGVSSRAFDGFHCVASDLAKPAAECPPLPVFYQGKFQEHGDLDVSPVTWHELAERGITLCGRAPVDLGIHTDAAELREFTRNNLDTYWRNMSEQLNQAGDEEIGIEDWVTRWCVIGVARLHHLLTTGELTSKSGAGRYAIEHLPEEWQRSGARPSGCARIPTVPASTRPCWSEAGTPGASWPGRSRTESLCRPRGPSPVYRVVSLAQPSENSRNRITPALMD